MLLRGFVVSHTVISIVYVISFIFVRRIIERIIRNQKGEQWSQEQKLKAIGHIRSVVLGVIVLGLIFVWAEELKEFTVSVFAIAVALVMALNELIRCVHGYLLLVRSNCYSLGDRISVGSFHGDVVGINLLFTTLLEVGLGGSKGYQGTGRLIFFPNSLLLVSFVVNSSLLEDFSFVSVEFPVLITDDWQLARSLLLEVAQEESQPFLEKARRRARELSTKQGMEIMSVEPRVFVKMTGPGELILTLRVATPSRLRDCVEQFILNRFLEKFISQTITKIDQDRCSTSK